MIMSILTIEISPEEQHKVLEILRYVNGPTRVKSGFINCRVFKELEKSDALTVVEEWESREDLYRHIRSEDYRAILAVMDMSSKAPKLQFSSVSQLGGLDVVSEARAE